MIFFYKIKKEKTKAEISDQNTVFINNEIYDKEIYSFSSRLTITDINANDRKKIKIKKQVIRLLT